MLELAVTTALPYYGPAILPQPLQDFPDLHQYTPTVVVAAKPRNGRMPLRPPRRQLLERRNIDWQPDMC
jgi:hypothetical protein